MDDRENADSLHLKLSDRTVPEQQLATQADLPGCVLRPQLMGRGTDGSRLSRSVSGSGPAICCRV